MYYLLYLPFWMLSLLPLWVLYRLSDVAYLLLYRVLGYRKQVVRDNLRYAFPGKTAEELRGIEEKFYRNFCDQWVETLKLLTLSEKQLNHRFKGNWEVFQKLAAEGKNTYAILAHTFNWEWANVACPHHTPQQYACVYLPLTNSAFDRLMLRIRSRSGAKMVSMKTLKSGLSQIESAQYILALAADQNPSKPETAVWLPFMHRSAPFFRGPEHMARRAKAAVVFAGIEKERRGHYRIHLFRYCDDASTYDMGVITQAYVHFVEQQLRKQPENWLWSHKRWKYEEGRFKKQRQAGGLP